MCKVQPVEQPKGAPFWSPILLTMSMTVATTPTMAIDESQNAMCWS